MLELRALLRTLCRSRSSSLAAVCLIGCGVAAATVTFAAADAVLWRALPYRDASRLALLTTASNAGETAVSLQDFLLVREAAGSASVAASGAFTPEFALTGFGEPRQLRGRVLSAGYFATLGIPLAAGREFRREEEKPGAGTVVMLTDRLWDQLFGRRQVIGTAVSMNGRSHTIVGVLPPFRDYLGDVDVYVPYQFPPTLPRKIKLFAPVVRLGPSQSVESLQGTLAALSRSVEPEEPGVRLTAKGLPAAVADRSRARAQTLFAAGGGLLLIAMLNFIMLTTARARQRHAEFAIRTSLGAPRWRIVLLGAAEAAALSAVGVALALELSQLALPLLQHLFGRDAVNEVGIGPRAIGFALAVAVLAVVATAVVITRVNMPAPSRRLIGARFATGRGFVVMQLALTVALGVSSIVLVRNFVAQRDADPGFVVDGRYTSRFALPAGKYADPARRLVFWRSLIDRLEADGLDAAIATELPLTGEDNPTPFVATSADGRGITVKVRSISPNYFAQMNMRIRDGRALAATDTLSAPSVVVVNEQLAKLLERSGRAVGQVLTFDFGGGPVRAVVAGIVSNIRHEGLYGIPAPESYFAFARDILEMVLRQSTGYAVAGIALGLALLAVAARSLSAVVHGVVVWDPAVILTYSLFVGLVSIAAASIPAWRAATISPAECLTDC